MVSQQKELNSSAKKLFKARDKYYKTCKEELNLPSPDTKKMTADKDAYKFQLSFTNKTFNEFFRFNFPQKLSEVRNSFVRRIERIQAALRSLITAKIDSFRVLDESINGQLLASINAIDADEEIAELNKKYNPSSDPFDKVINFEFQEYSEKGHVSLQVIASSAAESPLHLIPVVSSQDTSDEKSSSPLSASAAAPPPSLSASSALSPKMSHSKSKLEFGDSNSIFNNYSLNEPAVALMSPTSSSSTNVFSANSTNTTSQAPKKSKGFFKMLSSKRGNQTNHERRRSKSNELDISIISQSTASTYNSDSPITACANVMSPIVVASDMSLHSTVVMKVPLCALVERERALNPGANIPHVETFLVESLLALNPGGVKGIFKRGGKAQLIESLKKSLDEGVFDAPNDPYVCADVLKFWVRSLPEPLIPNSL